MEILSASPVEQHQRIDENLTTDLKVEPPEVRRWFTSNIVGKSLAYLVAFDREKKSKTLRCTTAGDLKVASTGAGLEVYERNPTSNVDGYITITGTAVKTETFKEVNSSLVVWTRANELYLEVSPDGATWNPKILLRGDLNETFAQDLAVKAVRLRNVVTDGTKDAKYQVVAMR
jgi:hypothetical protein